MFHHLNLSFNEVLSPRQETNYIILHHSNVDGSHTAIDIHHWHKNKGWAGIGYHYFINKKGDIFECRPHKTIGAHSIGFNNKSIGICFEGNFYKESMTEAQFSDEIVRILFFLNLTYPNSSIVFCDELENRTETPIKGFKKEQLRQKMEAFSDDFHYERQRLWGKESAQTFYDWWDEQLFNFGLEPTNVS